MKKKIVIDKCFLIKSCANQLKELANIYDLIFPDIIVGELYSPKNEIITHIDKLVGLERSIYCAFRAGKMMDNEWQKMRPTSCFIDEIATERLRKYISASNRKLVGNSSKIWEQDKREREALRAVFKEILIEVKDLFRQILSEMCGEVLRYSKKKARQFIKDNANNLCTDVVVGELYKLFSSRIARAPKISQINRDWITFRIFLFLVCCAILIQLHFKQNKIDDAGWLTIMNDMDYGVAASCFNGLASDDEDLVAIFTGLYPGLDLRRPDKK